MDRRYFRKQNQAGSQFRLFRKNGGRRIIGSRRQPVPGKENQMEFR